MTHIRETLWKVSPNPCAQCSQLVHQTSSLASRGNLSRTLPRFKSTYASVSVDSLQSGQYNCCFPHLYPHDPAWLDYPKSILKDGVLGIYWNVGDVEFVCE